MCLEKIELRTQECINHSRLNSQHGLCVCVWGGGLFDHLKNTKTFTLMMNKIFI